MLKATIFIHSNYVRLQFGGAFCIGAALPLIWRALA